SGSTTVQAFKAMPYHGVPIFRVIAKVNPVGDTPGFARLNYIGGAMPPDWTNPASRADVDAIYETLNHRASAFFADEPTGDVNFRGTFPGLRGTLWHIIPGSGGVDPPIEDLIPLGQ